jgi:hypothetical protein
VKAIYGLYPDGHAAQQAVNRLRAAGVADDAITVCSSQPMEEHEFGRRDRATWMWWLAVLGGLTGLSCAMALAWITETWWPIDVGGLPIFAWWPNLIIMFELTMLGAIVATVVTLVVAARLGRGGGLYDPEVSQGRILVGVERPADASVPALEAALKAPAGADVRIV